MALKILIANGFNNVKNLSGGLKTLLTATIPIATTSKSVADSGTVLNSKIEQSATKIRNVKVDACGLQCPGPIMRIRQEIDAIGEGDRVEMVSTDAGFCRDVQSWCSTTGNKLISTSEIKGKYIVVVEKGLAKTSCEIQSRGSGKTLIMFSNDLDKVIATFILAAGAAATGEKVSIFFTFWGLSAIKRDKVPSVKKDFLGKMFSMMLPKNSKGLSLSKMNMFGMGSKMMRMVMRHKGVDSLESLRQQAIDNGVEFIACQMSMDVMGVKKEELLDEVTIGGVATYMERADNANVNLFI